MAHQKSTCETCQRSCTNCGDQSSLHLHVEIENLKQRLLEKENHIVNMETNFLKEAEKFPNGEHAALTEEVLMWQEKYSRLYEAHKRVQKVNQSLEDKLLKIVDKCETEKNALSTEIANLTRKLVDEQFSVSKLQEDNERYKTDLNLAIQLLHCKPSNFVPQRLDALPSDIQAKVRSHLTPKSIRRFPDGNGNIQTKHEMKTIKVPIPTFPPTAMVYSLDKPTIDKESQCDDASGKPPQSPVDIVSAAIMAKVLEERERERASPKHCRTCFCSSRSSQNKCTQTDENDILFFTSFDFDNKAVMKNGSDSYKNPSFDSFEAAPKLTRPGIKFSKRDSSKSGFSVSKISQQPSNLSSSDEKLIQEINSSCNNCNNNNINNGKQKECSIGVTIPSADKFSDSDNDSPSTSCNLISFDNSSLSSSENCKENTSTKVSPVGPRLCSVRVQAGSHNILLDNAVNPYSTPVLYRSRFFNDATEPLVHSSRSRSTSISSSPEDASIVQRKLLCAETEI
ncbi:unnamed protein product [Bemisia tabaci]|uniref:Tight junction-associated protein 1 n=1 Tax=Bemisia tabaci TaxID=7038 RepID=A0A9P0F760_BEMTA|nr:unnamed protein product [Bemisia tabaci]